MNLSAWIGLRYYRARAAGGFVSLVSVVSFFGLMLGVMAMIVVVSVMNGFDRELKSRILGAVPHVVVDGRPDLTSLIETNPGISVSDFRETNVVLVTSRGSHVIRIHGVAAGDAMMRAIFSPAMKRGAFSVLDQPGLQVVLGEAIVRRFGLRQGDAVNLVTPRIGQSGETLRPRLVAVRLAGSFAMGSEMDYRLGVMTLDDLGQVHPGDTHTRLTLENIFAAPGLTASLKSQGLLVSDWTEEFGDFFQTVKMEKIMMFILLSFVVAVASFGIVSGLTMMVVSKRRDIAVLRTMGMEPRDVLRIFLVQGMGIALIGVAFGLTFGVLLAFYIPEVMGFVERLSGFSIVAGTYFDQIPVDVRWLDIVAVAAVGLLISFIATLYPSWRAAGLNPADVLRYE